MKRIGPEVERIIFATIEEPRRVSFRDTHAKALTFGVPGRSLTPTAAAR